MTVAEFIETTRQGQPPEGLPPALLALWHDRRGDWDAAHGVAQDLDTVDGSWIHAYLHRKEGDTANAGYWYRRAGKPAETDTLEAEWEAISEALLSRR